MDQNPQGWLPDNAFMGNVLFKCPTTGLKVQHWIAETPANELQCTYDGVLCPACTRLHFINRSTGKILGDNDRKA